MCWKNWYVKISTRKHNLNCNTKVPDLADLPTWSTLCNYGKTRLLACVKIFYSFETFHNIRWSFTKEWGFLRLTQNHSYSKTEQIICMTFLNTCNGSFSQCPAFHYFCQKGHTISQFPGIVSASLLLCDVPFPWHFQFPVSYLPSNFWPGTRKTIE